MLQKKITLALALFIMSATAIFAQLPYAKMIPLTAKELKEKKFKYDSNKNRHTLSKSNKTNQTMNVLSAIGGTTADIRPHEEDYVITVQKGANDETSSLNVLFYSDDTYHTIMGWAAENNIEVTETSSGKMNIAKFDFEGNSVILSLERVAITATTGRTSAMVKNIDESYNVYNYTIFTGIEPDSKWHTKEAAKKAKKKLKGDKQDLDDLM